MVGTPNCSTFRLWPITSGLALSSRWTAPPHGSGLAAVTMVMGLMSLMGADTNLWLMRVLMFLMGAAMAFAFVPVQTAAFATISSAATGRASALSNALRQLGSALGVAVIGEVLSAVGPTRQGVNGRVILPHFQGVVECKDNRIIYASKIALVLWADVE